MGENRGGDRPAMMLRMLLILESLGESKGQGKCQEIRRDAQLLASTFDKFCRRRALMSGGEGADRVARGGSSGVAVDEHRYSERTTDISQTVLRSATLTRVLNNQV